MFLSHDLKLRFQNACRLRQINGSDVALGAAESVQPVLIAALESVDGGRRTRAQGCPPFNSSLACISRAVASS